MKKTSFLAFIALFFYLVSCGPSKKITSSWVNKNFDWSVKYTKIFILVMNQNQSATNIVETDLAKAAEAKGYQVMKSSEYFTPSFGRSEIPSTDAIMARVRQLGCEAILTASMVDEKSEMRYVPGMNNMGMMGMGGMGMMGPGMGMGGMGMMGPGMGFGGFHGMMGPMMYNPGYYTNDKTYFIEANIFDVATETMIWESQSEVFNPTSISKFSRQYAKLLADRIRTDLARKK
jgi:hypothetical protein